MSLLDTILSLFGIKKSASDAVASAVSSASPAPAPSAADDDDDDDDDDDYERDYDQEAQDDSANFDFDDELEEFFVAQFKIEHAWEDQAKRAQLFAEHGIRDEPHYHQVVATFERWMSKPATLAKYGSVGDIMQVKMNATQKVAQQVIMGGGVEAMAGELEPVEGVTLQQWAKAQAGLAGGGDLQGFLTELGIDQAKWDRVSAEWNARMSRDTTATIATEYSKHFMGAGVGGHAAAGAAGMASMDGGAELKESDAPVTLDKYCEIMAAQAAGSEQGKDAAAILQSFGMTPMEWGQVGGWWSAFIAKNAMKNNGELHKRYTALDEKYTAKYKAADADSDISF